jgi:2-keto-4-pentenoate hydratase
MTPDAINNATEILANLRTRTNGQTSPLGDLPVTCRPATLDDAYGIQDALRLRLASQGLGGQTGWKIGCTTLIMQEYLDIPHPCAGTLYQATTLENHASLRAADYFQLGLECEIAVRLAADITPGEVEHTPESVAQYVGAVMTSVEIVDHRFRDFTIAATPSLVADDFFSVGCVIGTAQRMEDLGDMTTLIGGFGLNGAKPEIRGTGDAILGHPMAALAWLANHLSARGQVLRAEHIITLGSVVKTIYPEPGATIKAGFDRLVPVTLEIF